MQCVTQGLCDGGGGVGVCGGVVVGVGPVVGVGESVGVVVGVVVGGSTGTVGGSVGVLGGGASGAFQLKLVVSLKRTVDEAASTSDGSSSSTYERMR